MKTDNAGDRHTDNANDTREKVCTVLSSFFFFFFSDKDQIDRSI